MKIIMCRVEHTGMNTAKHQNPAERVIRCDAPPFAKGRTPVYLCHSLDQ
jgi:hypothetical protein